jgi:PleD family two-component response regulator
MCFIGTIRAGIAQYKIHKEVWQSLLNRADKTLYQAKNNGGNKWATVDS